MTAPVWLWGLVGAREEGASKHVWRGHRSRGSLRFPVLLGLLITAPRVKGAWVGLVWLQGRGQSTVTPWWHRDPTKARGLSRGGCQEQTLTLAGVKAVIGLSDSLSPLGQEEETGGAGTQECELRSSSALCLAWRSKETAAIALFEVHAH